MRERAGMERSPAAVNEEHEIPWIESVLHGDAPDRSGHDHGSDGDHAIGHPDHAVAPSVAQRLRDPLLDSALSCTHIELHFAAEKVISVEPPENQVRVGDRRFVATAAVAYRARRRARTLRADVEPLL